jgi:putative endopeptidase
VHAITFPSPRSFVANRIAVAEYVRRQNLARLGLPVDRSSFAMSPIEINAAYQPGLNQIVFPAAILQVPRFDPARPAAVNFGTIGMVMGHEMTHGFDDWGRHFDGRGGLRDWWSADVAAAFGRRSQCLVDEYSAFQPLPGRHLDGAFTLGENIADLGGVEVAFAAWARQGEADDATAWLTGPQQFFTAYAQGQCELLRDDYLDLALTTDPHSPGRFRANGVLVNSPAFASAFRCAPGTPMAPEARCKIW